jgi:hypothetical protein
MSTDIYYLSLSAMFVAAAVAVFVRSMSNASLAVCGLLAALAILSFQANVFLLPGLSAAIVLAVPSAGRSVLQRIALLWGTAVLVVGVTFISAGIFVYERRSLLELIEWGSSYSGNALWSSERLFTIVGTAFRSILGMELWMFEFFHARLKGGELPAWVAPVGAVILCFGLYVAFRRGPSRRPHETRTVAWLLILYAVYIPFFLWWDATEPRWFNLSNIFLAGVTAIIASRWWNLSYARILLPACVVTLGGLNLATSAWPRRFVTSTPLRMAACVAEQMTENDLFLATEWNWAYRRQTDCLRANRSNNQRTAAARRQRLHD